VDHVSAQAANADGRAEPPRLLITTVDFPPAHGGIQVLISRLAASMTGFQTRVVTLDAPGGATFDAAAGIEVVRAGGGFGRDGRPHGSRRRALALNAAALLQARRFRPDVTLCAHLVLSPAAAAIRRALGAPTAQYFYGNEIAGKRRLARFAAERADVSIAISSYTASLVAATGARPDGMVVIPPGVDLPRERAPLPAERPTLLTVARLNNSYKGHDVIIRALGSVVESVPDVQWVVIGDGPLRGRLEELARSGGVAGAARFLGAVGDEERNEWLRRADVFVMPSRLPKDGLAGEGFGIVFMEASAYGKPVVAGNVGGALDAVADGETGLLVDPTDPGALARALTTLLEDRALAAQMGARGAARAAEFAWPVVARRVAETLRRALAPQATA
jgi:phosphatidylinositol alpha-1,6-mannosyltransferase